MTDLSKAFDRNFIKSNYLISEKSYSLFSELLNIICSVLKRSNLGPLLFIIYICDFLIINKGANLLLVCSFEQVIPELKSILLDISQCFINNNLKANAGKFNLFLSHMRSKQ